jgi:hypothetical protein
MPVMIWPLSPSTETSPVGPVLFGEIAGCLGQRELKANVRLDIPKIAIATTAIK